MTPLKATSVGRLFWELRFFSVKPISLEVGFTVKK
ncbi:Uncharacterised protein [Streptococcus merionis]|uniref:Uncharacterized protein n=1 Tax=Streptococcus merionis TaxID=400065 RepID=A0A239STP2_9STRE|nr:Uncharacterised protein [Streptococcus merionis]